MFFGIIFVVIGLFILLDTLGVLTVKIWGLFWAIFFLAIGIKMMIKRGNCPMCGMHGWHEKMHGRCCEGGSNQNAGDNNQK